jgi:C4-dicarboxylate-specific signal transduction histidine kinase
MAALDARLPSTGGTITGDLRVGGRLTVGGELRWTPRATGPYRRALELSLPATEHTQTDNYGNPLRYAKRSEEYPLGSNGYPVLGELAAGLAHEINQPLAALKLTCQDFLWCLDKGKMNPEEYREPMQDMLKQVDLVSSIVAHMRDFAKPLRSSASQSADVNQLVRDVARLVNHSLRQKNIELRLNLSPDLPPLQTNAVKLQQVVMNLVANARDALIESGKNAKSISVETKLEGSGAGAKVVVSVADNGAGIPKEIEGKIFQPFFTTKVGLEGTGLGLSISRRIMDSLGGRLAFESRPGEGSVFFLTLPAGK